MKTYRKIFALFLAVLMLFSMVACNGEYNFALGGGTSSSGEYTPPVLDDDPTNDFTVTLRADGQAYTPRMEMYARWSDGFSVHTAPIDKSGVARIDGLDGDYRVTLSAVPNEYTYDPNTHIATNDNRNIVLDLYTLNRLSGGGTGLYDCYKFKKTGVYCAVVESPDDAIYFEYAPEGSGTYSIESWADTTADTINPYVEVYIGSSAWKQYAYTTNDGGTMGSYTINFLHTVQIAKENISSGGGQAVYTFAIKADAKNNKYPITITFAVKRDGNFELGGVDNISGNEMVIPTFDFSKYNVADHEYGAGYTVKYPEYQFEGVANTYVFDEARFKLWQIEDGGDGFYHVYNTEAYPDTDGYGPILYANITSTCRFLDRPFSRIEYRGNTNEVLNAALRNGKKNYKHFIEGYTQLATYGNINDGAYYCNNDCPCHDANVKTSGWACTSACAMCKADCRRIPEALIGHEGYQAYANSAGKVAVTAELKEFLLEYVSKEKGAFFNDGLGDLEKNGRNGRYYQAKGDSGWLFACSYYEPNA